MTVDQGKRAFGRQAALGKIVFFKIIAIDDLPNTEEAGFW